VLCLDTAGRGAAGEGRADSSRTRRRRPPRRDRLLIAPSVRAWRGGVRSRRRLCVETAAQLHEARLRNVAGASVRRLLNLPSSRRAGDDMAALGRHQRRGVSKRLARSPHLARPMASTMTIRCVAPRRAGFPPRRLGLRQLVPGMVRTARTSTSTRSTPLLLQSGPCAHDQAHEALRVGPLASSERDRSISRCWSAPSGADSSRPGVVSGAGTRRAAHDGAGGVAATMHRLRARDSAFSGASNGDRRPYVSAIVWLDRLRALLYLSRIPRGAAGGRSSSCSSTPARARGARRDLQINGSARAERQPSTISSHRLRCLARAGRVSRRSD